MKLHKINFSNPVSTINIDLFVESDKFIKWAAFTVAENQMHKYNTELFLKIIFFLPHNLLQLKG